MPVPNPSIAFALFNDRNQAEAALAKLHAAGFGNDQFELTAHNDASHTTAGEEPHGLFSPVRTLLLGGKRFGVQLYEQLVDLGIDEDEAFYFRDQVDHGKILVTVVSMRREREAAELLRQQGGRGAFESEPEVSSVEPALVKEDIAAVRPPDDVRTR